MVCALILRIQQQQRHKNKHHEKATMVETRARKALKEASTAAVEDVVEDVLAKAASESLDVEGLNASCEKKLGIGCGARPANVETSKFGKGTREELIAFVIARKGSESPVVWPVKGTVREAITNKENLIWMAYHCRNDPLLTSQKSIPAVECGKAEVDVGEVNEDETKR
jgi:hypothetical protein